MPYSGSAETFERFKKHSEYVPMTDGTEIAVDIFIPGQGEEKNQFPVIFAYTPYQRANINHETGKINDLETECRIPNKDNPFMNPTLSDYGSDKPPLPKSCPSYNNVGVQRRVEELFNEDLYRDVNDIFGKNNSQRQFYTVPGNQIPNDQHSFANWLYGTPSTCKEGNGIACLSDMGTTGGGGG